MKSKLTLVILFGALISGCATYEYPRDAWTTERDTITDGLGNYESPALYVEDHIHVSLRAEIGENWQESKYIWIAYPDKLSLVSVASGPQKMQFVETQHHKNVRTDRYTFDNYEAFYDLNFEDGSRRIKLPLWFTNGFRTALRYEHVRRESKRVEQQRRESFEQLRKSHISMQQEANPRIAKFIQDQKIVLGMTSEDAKYSWGEPTDINRSVGSYGVHEQWVYRRGKDTVYVYFENGILTSWQD